MSLAQKGWWKEKKSFAAAVFLRENMGAGKRSKGGPHNGARKKKKFGCLTPSLFSSFMCGIVVVGGFLYKKGSLSVAAGMFGE